MNATLNDWLAENPLRSWRKAQGINRLDFCTMAGYTPMSVLRWERGVNTPRWENIKRMAEQMDMEPGDLMSRWGQWLERRP